MTALLDVNVLIALGWRKPCSAHGGAEMVYVVVLEWMGDNAGH
uniref:Uncharacterized protein n=1 Tax=Mycobacterium riyadhense TaxID=486698 RepID=A0A653ERT6_9MYCO|nr:hypothetical protein BIN_B_03442 [Mycobacterium riyadhense]